MMSVAGQRSSCAVALKRITPTSCVVTILIEHLYLDIQFKTCKDGEVATSSVLNVYHMIEMVNKKKLSCHYVCVSSLGIQWLLVIVYQCIGMYRFYLTLKENILVTLPSCICFL